MNYWWVNHNQTGEFEIEGGFLWSPFRESDRKRSQFYENMRLACPGDLVISYRNQKVCHIGQVSGLAFAARKPSVFKSEGENWSREGWMLPIVWEKTINEFYPKDNVDQVSLLVPDKYSPLNKRTGGGNQKAYLAQISKQFFQFVLELTGSTLEAFADEVDHSSLLRERVDDDSEKLLWEDRELSETVRTQLIDARRGQGSFRQNVNQLEKCCRVTGVTSLSLLIASHIKPWRLCGSAHERIDGNNGLMLTPTVDHLFDRGLISFTNEGRVLVSERISHIEIAHLGLSSPLKRNVGFFRDQQKEYLKFHRESIYFGSDIG